MPVGISIDSKFSHAAFGAALGGVRYPLLSDFHPKGAVADSFGLYLQGAGITARATVLIDAGGTVRHISMASGTRDMPSFAELAESVDAAWTGALPSFPAPAGLPANVTLYIRDRCMFSRWALYIRANLGIAASLPVKNVSTDDEALKSLIASGGKGQAPALDLGDSVLYESDAIAAYLAEHCALP